MCGKTIFDWHVSTDSEMAKNRSGSSSWARRAYHVFWLQARGRDFNQVPWREREKEWVPTRQLTILDRKSNLVSSSSFFILVLWYVDGRLATLTAPSICKLFGRARFTSKSASKSPLALSCLVDLVLTFRLGQLSWELRREIQTLPFRWQEKTSGR